MNSDWQEGVLGDFIELKRGYDLPKNKRNPGHIPLVSSSGVSDFQSESMVKGPGVVTGRYGTIGQVFYITGDFWPLNTTLYVRDFKGNDPKFISYFLKTLDFEAYSDKAAVPGINRNHIHEAKVLIPPFDVQKRISKVLGAIDDFIAVLRETNATLESMAQAIFKSWFVDFDPVRAKAEGRQPERMDAETAALFPDSFEESELRVVPKGWSVGTLSDLSLLNPESWSAKSHPETIAYVDLANAKENVVGEITEYNFDDAPSRARRVLRNGDTIVGTVRPGNRSFALISYASASLTGSTGFAVLRPKQKENTEFVYLAATADCSIEYLAHVADGAAYPAVRPEVVANLPCLVPGEHILRAFHETVKPMFEEVGSNNQQTQTLSQLRDTLLPKLISGEIRLPETESIISDAVSA